MRAVIVKALADLRRRRLQATVIFLTVLLAMAAGTTAVTLMSQTRDPYQIAFDKQRGAHLQVAFNATTDPRLLGIRRSVPCQQYSVSVWRPKVLRRRGWS
jgi:hypothetical protein